MDTPQTDLDLPLVRALQTGDERALNELIRKYQEPLFGFIWRYPVTKRPREISC